MKQLIIITLFFSLILVGCNSTEEISEVLENTSSAIIDSSDSEVNEVIPDIKPKIIKINVDILNVRESYNIESEKLAQVALDSVYTVVEEFTNNSDELWYKINYEEEKEGWIASWFCSDTSLSNIPEVFNEFALYIDGNYYPLDENYLFDSILVGSKYDEFTSDFPYPAGRIHYGENVKISTFLNNDEKEYINNIIATKDAKTPRGVGIGSSLNELKDSYSELKYEGDWISDDNEPRFNRVYIYSLEESRKFIAFFLYEREIVMISVEDGYEFMPGKEINDGNILGVKGVIRETNNLTSKGATYKYYYTNEIGEEILLIEIKESSIYEVDIDDDNITELVVYLNSNNNKRSIGIYDLIDGEISYIDINKKMGSLWSSGMENISNLKPEYSKCVELGFDDDNGKEWSEVYKVIDNELIYVTNFSRTLLN